MSDRTVRVTLAAQVNGYISGMEQARKATDKTKDAAADAAAKFEQQNQAMRQVGGTLMAAGAVALAATGIAVKAAVDWESAWAGVTKTVDGSAKELSELQDGLRGLAKELPASHEQIAAVAEAAGQLGIQTPNVLAFTRVMIDLGETTNLSAEEAATSLARFSNIMGTSQGDMDRLGSAIVGLGNNYATTEGEIVAMSMRLAGAGKQAKLSEGDVLGLATAMSSVGIEAEAGGTAMSLTMKRISKEVEMGGDQLGLFAQVAGMSSQEFSTAWKTDAAGALAVFVEGLANTEKLGMSTNAVLSELGVTGIREADALLRLSSAQGLMSSAMKQGNAEYEANIALTAEAEKRYATAASKLQVMSNRVNDAAIDFGNVFLPALTAVAEVVGGLATAFSDMPEGVQTVVAVGVALAGAAALAGGAFLLAVPKIAEFRGALGVLSESSIPAVSKSVAIAQAGASKFSSFMAGPWAAALAAAAIGTVLLKNVIDDMQLSSEELQNSLATSKSAMDLLAKPQVLTVTGMKPLIEDSEELRRVLSIAETEASGFFGWLGANTTFDSGNKAFGEFRQGWTALGKEMAAAPELIGPNLQRVREEFKLTDKEMMRLIDLSPELKDALTAQATAAGVAATDVNLLQMAMAKAEPVTNSAANAYIESAKAAADLTGEVTTLMDAVNAANGVGQDAVSTNARYQSALSGITDEVTRQKDEWVKAHGSLNGYTFTLDENTTAGSANAAMLGDVAKAAQDAAKAKYEEDKSTVGVNKAMDNYLATLETSKRALEEQSIANGANADQVKALTDRVFEMPDQKTIDIMINTAAAANVMDGFIRTYNGKTVRLDVVTDSIVMPGTNLPRRASGGILPGAPSRTDNMLALVASGEFVTNAHSTANPSNRAALEYMNAGGVINGYANGGEVRPQYASSSGSRQTVVMPSLEGMAISGTLAIGGDGLGRIIDGRIVKASAADAYRSDVALSGGRVSP